MHENYYQSKEFEELLNKYEVAMQHGDSVYFEPDELTDIAEYYHVHGQRKTLGMAISSIKNHDAFELNGRRPVRKQK